MSQHTTGLCHLISPGNPEVKCFSLYIWCFSLFLPRKAAPYHIGFHKMGKIKYVKGVQMELTSTSTCSMSAHTAAFILLNIIKLSRLSLHRDVWLSKQSDLNQSDLAGNRKLKSPKYLLIFDWRHFCRNMILCLKYSVFVLQESVSPCSRPVRSALQYEYRYRYAHTYIHKPYTLCDCWGMNPFIHPSIQFMSIQLDINV